MKWIIFNDSFKNTLCTVLAHIVLFLYPNRGGKLKESFLWSLDISEGTAQAGVCPIRCSSVFGAVSHLSPLFSGSHIMCLVL